MTPTILEILVVIALGTLGGTALGLALGYMTGNQKNAWSLMTRRQRWISSLLIIVGAAFCITAIGWYSFFIATSV